MLEKDGKFTIPTPVTQATTVRVTATAGGISNTVFLVLTPPADAGNAPAKKAASPNQ